MVNKKKRTIVTQDDNDAWDFFGLSYASWLVLPRIALQSMPIEWQQQFFKMVRELGANLEYPEGYTHEYVVTTKRGNKFIRNPLPHYRHNNLPYKEASE